MKIRFIVVCTILVPVWILLACTAPIKNLNPRPPMHGQLQKASGCNAQTGEC